jgi:hypothetical protein
VDLGSVPTLFKGPGWLIRHSYGLEGPGIESRRGRDFPHRPDKPWGLHSLQYNGYRVSFLGVMRSGVALTNQPHLASRLNRVKLYLYFTSWPSWPVSKVNFTFYPTHFNNSKDKAVPVHPMKIYRGNRHTAPLFNFETTEVKGQLHAPAPLTPGKNPGTHCTRGWVGPRAGLDGCRKSQTKGNHPRTVQSVSGRYANLAITVHAMLVHIKVNFWNKSSGYGGCDKGKKN